MPTTDEDLQKKRQHVEDLRQKVADKKLARELHLQSLENDHTAIALDAEADSLEAELVEAKRISKLDTSVEDTEAVVVKTPVQAVFSTTTTTAK